MSTAVTGPAMVAIPTERPDIDYQQTPNGSMPHSTMTTVRTPGATRHRTAIGRISGLAATALAGPHKSDPTRLHQTFWGFSISPETSMSGATTGTTATWGMSPQLIQLGSRAALTEHFTAVAGIAERPICLLL